MPIIKEGNESSVKDLYFSPTKIMVDDSRKLKIKSYDGTKSETK